MRMKRGFDILPLKFQCTFEVAMTISKFVLPAILATGAWVSIGAASAADLPARTYSKAPAMVPASVYNWTGLYIGIEGGGDWGRSQHYNNDPTTPAVFGLPQTGGINLSGGLVGGTIGYNYQFSNNVVIGIENDISWTNFRGTAPLIAPFNLTETAQTSQSWLDTLRGRLGYAWDRVLLFGTGGAAFTNEKFQLCDPVTGCGGASRSVAGWTAGAGVEYAFANSWSAKLEYLHVDFGRNSYGFAPNSTGLGAGGFAPRQVSLTDDIVRAGVNYRIDWAR
jgi:outer membrane immunogenic protein